LLIGESVGSVLVGGGYFSSANSVSVWALRVPDLPSPIATTPSRSSKVMAFLVTGKPMSRSVFSAFWIVVGWCRVVVIHWVVPQERDHMRHGRLCFSLGLGAAHPGEFAGEPVIVQFGVWDIPLDTAIGFEVPRTALVVRVF
jgi:hypothetical protein